MANLANFNGVVSDKLAAIPKLVPKKVQRTQKRVKITANLGKKPENYVQVQILQSVTRRLVLGITTISVVGNACNGVSLAEENRFWIDGPLPVPLVFNDIANDKTGTRSFLKKGIYIADIGTEGRKYRLKKYAFDLLAMEDLIGKDTLNYVRKYLRLKSTFMYYDFDKVISAAAGNDKQPLTDLANRLFDKFEKLEDAAKRKNLTQTESCYQETTPILQEVMDRMA